MRASAVSVSVATLWVASFLLTYTFPLLNRAIGTSGAFLLYAVICFAGAAFVFAAVPETNGRPLETIQDANPAHQ
jgi:MFS transporter, SP family, xylose:H+ symportor